MGPDKPHLKRVGGEQGLCEVLHYIFMSNERTERSKYVKEKLAKTWLNQIKGGFPGIFAVYLTVYLRFIGA